MAKVHLLHAACVKCVYRSMCTSEVVYMLKFPLQQQINFNLHANGIDQDQTAPLGAVCYSWAHTASKIQLTAKAG